LLETKRIEEHILHVSSPGEQLLFQAQLILDPALDEKAMAQQKAYSLIRSYGRKKLQEEIALVHAQLFQSPQHTPFKERILSLFQKK